MSETTVLSAMYQRCLENCHSYKKYWWFRTLFEQEKCPLCEHPKEVYPLLYKNNHWRIYEDTFAEKETRIITLTIAFDEHMSGFDWNSFYASIDLHNALLWIERNLSKELREHGGMIHGRIGDALRNVDTIPNHYHQTCIIPNGTDEVRVPVFKGPTRQQAVSLRAKGFAERFEAGELPAT